MIDILGIGTLIIIAIIQRYVLSNNRYVWLGSILPIIFLVSIIGFIIYTKQGFNISNMLLIFFGTTILLGLWNAGHESYKRKIKKEYDVTKAKDHQI